ncbi:MAG: LysR family transcriptional regulator [Pseudomonadota bacterium]
MTTRIALRLRLLRDGEVAIGPGKADLLDAIRASGSISAAARAMDMSYRRAWLLVDVMNRSFREPLVVGAAGGRQGGGASVTEAGLRALAQFRTMEAAALAAARPHLDALIEQLRTDSLE